MQTSASLGKCVWDPFYLGDCLELHMTVHLAHCKLSVNWMLSNIDLNRLPGHCDWFIWCMHCCRLLAATVHRQGGSIYIYKPQVYCLMWCTVFRIDCQATVLDSQTDVLPHDMQCIKTRHSGPGKVLALCLIHRMYALLSRMHACTLLTATVDRQYSSLQAIGTLNWIHWLL